MIDITNIIIILIYIYYIYEHINILIRFFNKMSIIIFCYDLYF